MFLFFLIIIGELSESLILDHNHPINNFKKTLFLATEPKSEEPEHKGRLSERGTCSKEVYDYDRRGSRQWGVQAKLN